jgi:hypothetical protein
MYINYNHEVFELNEVSGNGDITNQPFNFTPSESQLAYIEGAHNAVMASFNNPERDKAKIKQIYNLLKESNITFMVDRKEWLGLGYMIYGLHGDTEEGLNLYHDFSKLAKDAYDKEGTDNHYKRMKTDFDPNRKSITIGTLIFKAKALGIDLGFREQRSNGDVGLINIPEALVSVKAPYGVLYSIDDSAFLRINCISGEFLIKTKDTIKEELASTLEEGVTSLDLITIPKVRVMYKPYENDFFLHYGETTFNTFKPTELMLLPKTEVQEIPPNVKIVLDNNVPDPKEQHHFLNWIATLYQTRRKSQVAWVWLSKKGSGKGTMFDLLVVIFGEENAETVNQEDFTSQYNDWCYRNLLVNPDEISSNKETREALENLIKGYITGSTVGVNNKYGDKGRRENCFNLFFHSNNAVPVVLDPDDRRFCVSDTRTSGKKLIEIMNCTQDVAHNRVMSEVREFAQYLANFKIDVSLYHTPINNQDKKNVSELGDTEIRQFVKALISGNADYFEEFFEMKKGRGENQLENRFKESAKTGFIPNSVVCEIYNWISDANKHPASLKTLLRKNDLPNNIDVKIKNVKGIKVKPFVFPPNQSLNGGVQD